MEFFIICCLLIVVGIVGCALQVFSVRAAAKANERNGAQSQKTGQFSPPVTILKPLRGLDDNLFDNLASFCTLDYPRYEIIFALQDQNDPAYKIAKRVQDTYRNIAITIHVERTRFGLNPKVNNLSSAYARANYDYLLISDSNVLVEKNYLVDIVHHMANPHVGLVSNIIRGIGGRSVGAIFENLHLNSFIVGSVCMLDRLLKMPCVVGKSMLMRKADFEALGGFSAVKDVLAEDYVIGRKMHDAGKGVVLSTHVINNVNEFWSLKKFLNRHSRWGKLRWRIGGYKYISELIGNPFFVACLPAIFWETTQMTLWTAAFVGCLKIISDFLIGRSIGCSMPASRYLMVPIKDFIIGVVWFIPLMSQTVTWRGNKYVIGKDSCLAPCTETWTASVRYRLAEALRSRFA